VAQDIGFGAPYLHLGEMHLQVITDPSVDHKEKRQLKKRAALCFTVALALEGRRTSRVRKRCETMLEYLKQLS
jgi:hypothetical protein